MYEREESRAGVPGGDVAGEAMHAIRSVRRPPLTHAGCDVRGGSRSHDDRGAEAQQLDRARPAYPFRACRWGVNGGEVWVWGSEVCVCTWTGRMRKGEEDLSFGGPESIHTSSISAMSGWVKTHTYSPSQAHAALAV